MSINLINVTNPKNLKDTINSILQTQADLAGSIQNFDSKIPTLLSQLLNDVGFITNTVDNLINYYSKSDVNALLAAVKTFSAQVVTTLPTTNVSTTTIYLIAAEDAVTGNYYNEYLYINNSWELIGTTKLDLSNYYTKAEVDARIPNLTNYYTKSEIDVKFTEVNTKLAGIDTLLDNINGEVV